MSTPSPCFPALVGAVTWCTQAYPSSRVERVRNTRLLVSARQQRCRSPRSLPRKYVPISGEMFAISLFLHLLPFLGCRVPYALRPLPPCPMSCLPCSSCLSCSSCQSCSFNSCSSCLSCSGVSLSVLSFEHCVCYVSVASDVSDVVRRLTTPLRFYPGGILKSHFSTQHDRHDDPPTLGTSGGLDRNPGDRQF